MVVAKVEVGVICPSGSVELPKGLPEPSVASLQVENIPGAIFDPTVSSTERFKVPIDKNEGLCVPGPDVAQLNYNETVSSCTAVSYTPYVAAAKRAAVLRHSVLTCAPPCKKRPAPNYTYLGKSCSANVVTIVLQWEYCQP